jgi:hypothetical protein
MEEQQILLGEVFLSSQFFSRFRLVSPVSASKALFRPFFVGERTPGVGVGHDLIGRKGSKGVGSLSSSFSPPFILIIM